MSGIAPADRDAFFKENYSQFQSLINKRKRSWRATSVMEFEDLQSVLLTRLYQQLHRYDSNRPLDRWANTVITNTITNILRDKIFKNARPCIAATSYGNPCVFARGCDGCAWTKSGKQDSSCRFYANWEKKKQAKFVVSTPLSMEAHLDETHSIQSDFLDIDGAKKVIDDKIMPHLNKEEAKIYRLLYIEHLDMKVVGRKMGYKKQKNSEIPGYLILRTAVLRFKELSREIIEAENIC